MKKKKPVVFYQPIDGSAPLSIYWYDGPKGNAVEANNVDGVGFFGPSGELLGVIFDDVTESKDQQHLEFDHHRVDIVMNKGKASYSLTEIQKKAARTPKKSSRPNEAA